MTSPSPQKRASGILAHITSLPSSFGIGDIGHSAYQFVDFLSASGQSYWQILPTNPTCLLFDSSPYMSVSAFAGSPLIISPELLQEDGLITPKDIVPPLNVSPYLTKYSTVTTYKQTILRTAYDNFKKRGNRAFSAFCKNTRWLDDYALFMSLKQVHDDKPWFEWPVDCARRSSLALDQARKRYKHIYDYYRFEQFIFNKQWSKLRTYCNEKSIQMIGDIPIYIGLDSADVWSHQYLFELDKHTFRPRRISGVPPDYFSKDGQRWGNPLYRWNSRQASVRNGLLDWWTGRFNAVFSLVDVARIDHFRGFESYWAIPEHEETAVNGTWVRGPGASFFKTIQKRLGPLAIIAEDLGEISERVIKLREATGYPGMKVLQFAFDGNPANPFLPHNFSTSNCVVYTGTHDNNTTLGWFLSEDVNDNLRSIIKALANREPRDASPINQDLIYLALSSIANLAIIPLQDLLGFGSDCRMNTPGVANGNWQWRCAPEFLTDERATWLKTMTHRFSR